MFPAMHSFTLHSQSLSLYCVVDCDTMWSYRCFLTFQRNLSALLLKICKIYSSEMLVINCKTTQHHNPKDQIPHFTTVNTSNLIFIYVVCFCTLSISHFCEFYVRMPYFKLTSTCCKFVYSLSFAGIYEVIISLLLAFSINVKLIFLTQIFA
jgi:hypothetical protein